LRHVEAGKAAVFANLTPLVGAVVAAVIFHEPMSPYQIARELLILGAV
jgi:drug/metabolite transporter (DMT)-like permease